MKLALLSDGVWPLSLGGMQKHTFNLLKGMLIRKVDVLFYHPGKGSVLEHIPAELHDNLTEVIIPFGQSSAFPGAYMRSSYLHSIAIAQDLLKREKVDFIYAQGFTAWRLCQLRSKGDLDIPIGVNFHGLEMFQQSKGLKQKLIQWMFKGPVKYNIENSDIAYSLGGKLTAILNKFISADRISVIPIAVGNEWLKGKQTISHDSERVKVLFIGRYERRKGVEELNRAINTLSEDDRFEFHFIGPIPMSKRISMTNVFYHGKISEEESIRDLIDVCDVLCVPSFSEGMPTVILEAMARGLAIIASDVGAVRDLVDENNGYLIRPGDPQKIVWALKEFSASPEDERIRLSHNSISKVEQDYIWEKVIDKILLDIETRFNN
ncbi:MAG: glycosyltransferase family 4 protein [Flavobacteriales bacterium]|nr:glycosyltransferase family 4 protein [Flavobacteriales bacterium]